MHNRKRLFRFGFDILSAEKQIENDNYSDNGKHEKRNENARRKPERHACSVIGVC